MSDSPHQNERFGALILIAAPLLAMVFMAMHPSVQAHSTAEAFAEMAREAAVNRIVHSILIALLALHVVGFWVLLDRLGRERLVTMAGFMAYALGFAAQTGAAIVNGLTVTSYQLRFANAPLEQMDLARNVLTFAWSLNQACAQVGVVATSVAILCWSTVMMRKTGAWRVLGGLGVLVGLAPALGVMAGVWTLNVAGFGAIIVAQSVWTIGVGALLATNSFRKAAS